MSDKPTITDEDGEKYQIFRGDMATTIAFRAVNNRPEITIPGHKLTRAGRQCVHIGNGNYIVVEVRRRNV